MRKRKQSLIAGIVLVVLALGIGYAYLSTTLSINGSSKINNASWNIHFENVQVTTGSISADTPVINPNTTVTYDITLSNPGDFYEFTLDVKNDGTIDAMIDTVISKLNNVEITTLPNYLDYTINYADETEIQSKQELNSGAKETYKIKVEYKKDINVSDMPTTEQNLSLSFSVTYVQKDDTSSPVPHPSFETDSWPEVINNLKNNNACGTIYQVGDEKEIDLGSFGIHTVRISNCSTPTECSNSNFSQSACGTVLEFKDGITKYGFNAYDKGWADSEIRNYINSTIYNSFPSEIKASIIDTNVISIIISSNPIYYTSTDKIYLVDLYEVTGNSNTHTRQLDYYLNAGVSFDESSRRYNHCTEMEKMNENIIIWYTRDVNVYNNNYDYNGISDCYMGNPFVLAGGNGTYISPAFRIG